jgi:hypothetical protein
MHFDVQVIDVTTGSLLLGIMETGEPENSRVGVGVVIFLLLVLPPKKEETG